MNHFLSRKTLLPTLGVLLALVLLWGACWLYGTLSEVGLTGLLHLEQKKNTSTRVHLKEQPVYQIKRKRELLGVQVIRIISKQQPEEFLVLAGVPKKTVETLYGKPIDLSWANLMANQLVKLREGPGGDETPVSVIIEDVKTLKSGTMPQGNQKLPYWQIEVRFQLSNESAPRYYQATIVRHNAETQKETDTLVVGYAQKDAFDQKLVSDLINQLSVEGN